MELETGRLGVMSLQTVAFGNVSSYLYFKRMNPWEEGLSSSLSRVNLYLWLYKIRGSMFYGRIE